MSDILANHFPESHSGYDLLDGYLIDGEVTAEIDRLHPAERRLLLNLSGLDPDQYLWGITHDEDEIELSITPEILTGIVEGIVFYQFKENYLRDYFPVLELQSLSFLPGVGDDYDVEMRYPDQGEENDVVWTLEELTTELRSMAYYSGRCLRAYHRELTGTDLYFNDRLYNEYLNSMMH